MMRGVAFTEAAAFVSLAFSIALKPDRPAFQLDHVELDWSAAFGLIRSSSASTMPVREIR